MNFPNNRPLSELLSDTIGQLSKLVGNEFELARAEISEKAAQTGRAAMMISAGAIVLVPAIVMLLLAASVALIHSGFTEPVAYLLVGLGTAAVSAVLIAMGLSRMSGDALKPSVTLDQLQRDKAAAKEMMR